MPLTTEIKRPDKTRPNRTEIQGPHRRQPENTKGRPHEEIIWRRRLPPPPAARPNVGPVRRITPAVVS